MLLLFQGFFHSFNGLVQKGHPTSGLQALKGRDKSTDRA
jgi:hypothetical protein